jgi:hypothetical protein
MGVIALDRMTGIDVERDDAYRAIGRWFVEFIPLKSEKE